PQNRILSSHYRHGPFVKPVCFFTRRKDAACTGYTRATKQRCKKAKRGRQKEKGPVFCCEETGPKTPPLAVQCQRNYGVACYTAQLGGDTVTMDSVAMRGYELRVLICNYQNFPITAENTGRRKSPLLRVSILFRPRRTAPLRAFGRPASPKLRRTRYFSKNL